MFKMTNSNLTTCLCVLLKVYVLNNILGTRSEAPPNATSNLLDCWECPGGENVDCADTELLDLFPDKIEVTNSLFWNISYHGTYKIIRNTREKLSYLLYQCGTEPPANSEIEHDVVVSVPLKNGLALTQTTDITHMELLGKRRDIKGYIGNPSYISSPCLNDLISDNETDIVDPSNETAIEEWLQINPGSIILGSPYYPDKTQRELVIFSESYEKENMAIYEWQKAFAAFFNYEKEANEMFAQTQTEYECITANAADKIDVMNVTSVVWAYYSSWGGGWDVGSCPNYYCEYARHCSAEFLHSDEGSIEKYGYKYMTTTEFVSFAKNADVWVYASGDWDSVYTNDFRMQSELRSMRSVRTRQVFDYQGNGPNAWFEQRMAEPDVVLSDFCDMIDRETFDEEYNRVWLRNVYTEPLQALPTCSDVDAPHIDNSATCFYVTPKS